MFKKLLVSSVVLAMSSTAFAGGYKGEGKYKESFKDVNPCPCYQYMVGPYLGLSAGVRDNYSGGPNFYKGIEGTVSAGYAAMLAPQFYLAGEIFGGGSGDLKNYVAPGSSSVKTSWDWGLSLIPGYMITDHVLGYLRLGGIQSHFNGSGQSTNKWAWQVGLGGQTNIVDNWDLRGEYVYSQYGNVGNAGKVGADQFNLGIVYKFV